MAYDILVNYAHRRFEIGALESPGPLLFVFAAYEYLRALREHLRHHMNHSLNQHVGMVFGTQREFTVIKYARIVLIDAREVLADARNLQECKVGVKGFQTH